jgi:hypothetical protein
MITRIALLGCMAHATAYGSETRQKLTACLQVEIPDPHLISRLAQGLASRIFAHIGISLDWRACEPADESSQAPIVIELASGTRKISSLAYLDMPLYKAAHHGFSIN